MLEDSIDDKINQSREEMNEYHNPIFNQRLSIEIEALEWVQLQIEQLVKSRAKKRNKLT
jgi:phosphoenolpyruvate synthase/pyruvate phosphate dikinase